MTNISELNLCRIRRTRNHCDQLIRVTVSALLSLVGPAHQPLLPLAAFKCDVFSVAAPPLASFRKIQGLPISKTVRTADSTIIIITIFYLAASSHEIFLRVGGREGMKGLGALQRHQLPHPPCKNPGSATVCFEQINLT